MLVSGASREKMLVDPLLDVITGGPVNREFQNDQIVNAMLTVEYKYKYKYAIYRRYTNLVHTVPHS